MSVALLTTSRGDRPKMLEHCRAQVRRFTTDYDLHIVIDNHPKGKGFDLTERVYTGYKIAKEAGIDWIVIVEDDDFYPADYLHKVMMNSDKSDFIGCEFTFYNNVKLRTWERLYHPNRSSLFTTAFRVSAMEGFRWDIAHKLFLDIDIWQYAKRHNFRRTFTDAGAVGIKGHGEGMSGGKGHSMKLKNQDPDLKWLSSKVDKESLEFYKSFGE
jgi:hypothetical protein